MRTSRSSVVVLGTLSWCLAACSIGVDTSSLAASGCRPDQALCDDKCVDLTDPGYGCGTCVVCGGSDSDSDGYSIQKCVLTTPPNNAAAASGRAESFTCAFVKCIEGFHGPACNIPDNDFTGYERCESECRSGGACTSVRADVSVCL